MSIIRDVALCVIAVLCLISAVRTAALAPCTGSAQDCHERRMHPDLPEEPTARMSAKIRLTGEDTTEFWRTHGEEFVRNRLAEKLNKQRAKNVIMFLGDGMGLTTIAAARNLLGGEEQQLSFEKFNYTGLAKTYSVDKIVPDSACTATAYLGGVKAQEGTIGVNGQVDRGDCETMKDTSTHVDSIAKWAQAAGKWTGVVTTTRITHASPAGVYAHIADRDWENDVEVYNSCGAFSFVDDIAYQLIHGDVGSQLKVMLGGGRKNFVDASLSFEGKRADGLDLIDDYKSKSTRNVYVEEREELLNVDVSSADRLLGLFNADHLNYHLDMAQGSKQPTLEEMTRKAIEYLSQSAEGYFIFIEGGRIDQAHHDNKARKALDETIEFSKAIAAARELTSEDDTLILVTADHSHSFSYSGYSYRGNDIFGSTPGSTDDGKPYMTLNYANGPSYSKFYDGVKMERVDPTTVITGHVNDEFPAGVPLEMETHGGDDVPVYASGPWAHLFTGVYEQNTIPHIMGYAACLGSGLKMCDN